jgi:hypothetical protein
MFILSFYEVPKGVLQKLDFYRLRFFFGKEMNTRSIGWPNGRLSIDKRIREGWVFWIWKYKIDASLANDSLI